MLFSAKSFRTWSITAWCAAFSFRRLIYVGEFQARPDAITAPCRSASTNCGARRRFPPAELPGPAGRPLRMATAGGDNHRGGVPGTRKGGRQLDNDAARAKCRPGAAPCMHCGVPHRYPVRRPPLSSAWNSASVSVSGSGCHPYRSPSRTRKFGRGETSCARRSSSKQICMVR